MEAPSVSVVIPSYNRREMVERLVASVLDSEYPRSRLEVIVVDDGSDEDYAGVGSAYEAVRLIRNEQERYLAEARNIGAREATGQYLFFVDDDNVLAEDTIAILVDHLEQHPNVGVAGPAMYYFDQPGTVWCAGIERDYWTSVTTFLDRGKDKAELGDEPRRSEDFPNAFMVRRDVFERCGGFDSDRFPIHYDEADFCQRVRKRGFDVTCVPQAEIWHDIVPPDEDMRRSFHLQSEFRAFYAARNRVIYHVRHNSWTQLGSFLLVALPAISLYYLLGILLSGSEDRIEVAGAYARGTISGLLDSLSPVRSPTQTPHATADPVGPSEGSRSTSSAIPSVSSRRLASMRDWGPVADRDTLIVGAVAVGFVAIYLWVESSYVTLPLVGPHAFNESTFLLVIRHMLEANDPTSFVTRYDPASPTYNGRYLYYWTVFIYLKGLSLLGLNLEANLALFVRLFSVASSIAGFYLVYRLCDYLVGWNGLADRLSYVLVAGLYLFSPLVLWYGSKSVIEPFVMTVYLVLMYLLLMALEGGDTRRLYAIAFAFGVVAVSRSPFLVLAGVFPLARILYPSTVTNRDLAFVSIFGFVGFMAPVLVTQAIHPEYDPLRFIVVRFLEVAPRQAATDRSGQLMAVRYLRNSLLPTLGLLGFSSVAFPLLDRREFRQWSLFFLPSFAYFTLTYQHNIIHNYHNYYFVVPALLIVAFVFHRLNHYEGFRADQSIVVILVLSAALFGSNLYLFDQEYPLEGEGNVYVSQPAGNKWSIYVGKAIGLAGTDDASYNLLTSPVTGYYSEHQFIGYKFFFVWNETTREYDRRYDYYANPTAFVNGLAERRVTYLVTSPAVHANADASFETYLSSGYVRLDKIGPFTVYVNRNENVVERQSDWIKAKHALADDPITARLNVKDHTLSRVAYYPLENASQLEAVDADRETLTFTGDAVQGDRSLEIVSERDEAQGWSQVQLRNATVERGRYLVLTTMKYDSVSQAHIVISGYNASSGHWFQLAQVPSGRDGSAEWTLYDRVVTVPPDVTKIRPILKAGRQSASGTRAVTRFDVIEIHALEDPPDGDEDRS